MCPGDLTSPTGNYVDQLRVHMSKLKRITTREQSRATFVSRDRTNRTQVSIRCDEIKALLNSPSKVLSTLSQINLNIS